jgi:endonuclease/exonuclease/phosphatase family metal-dependent hydrolase
VLVRSWNLFHGNTVPPGRRAYLREMVELVTADRPDVVCLQEVPGWALARVGAWSGMTALPVWTRRARLGPQLGRVLTAPHHGVIRSAFAGQGNAILLAPELEPGPHATLSLPRTREPRVAQRVELGGIVVVNLHSSHGADGEGQVAAALRWAEEPAAAVLVLAGDFNTTPERSRALRGASFAGAIPASIDQVLVRGADAVSRRWAEAEREYDGRLLSDHAPVEARIEL